MSPHVDLVLQPVMLVSAILTALEYHLYCSVYLQRQTRKSPVQVPRKEKQEKFTPSLPEKTNKKNSCSAY